MSILIKFILFVQVNHKLNQLLCSIQLLPRKKLLPLNIFLKCYFFEIVGKYFTIWIIFYIVKNITFIMYYDI